MAKQELKKLPALNTDGVQYAKRGTVVVSVLAVISQLAYPWLKGTDFEGLRSLLFAATVLGVIGIAHVTRRARRITQR